MRVPDDFYAWVLYLCVIGVWLNVRDYGVEKELDS